MTVTFTATDNLSGVAAGGCAAPMVLGSDGAGQSASGSCVDRAGNISTPATVAGINVDTAAPVAAVDVDPDANAYGWNNTNVTVSFSGVDAMSGSGIDSCSPAALVSAEGAAQVRNGSCSDVAGNSSATVSASVSLDRTAPTASITTPPAGATYIMGTAVPAAYACSDGLSGIDSCTGPVPNGGNVDTVTAGSKSFVVTATDRAGNAAGSTHAYTVIPPYTFLGFLSPTDNLPTINRVTPGRVIPIKWRLQKPDGSYATDTATLVSLLSAPVACDASPTDLVEEQLTSAGSTVFRYDATENQFIYNWQSAKAWRGCRLLQVNVRDLPPQYAKFEFR